MKKDYNANTTGGDSEDEEDPRTPTSVSSQGSQGYDSAGSDFVDIEGFSQITPLPDSSLPEISLQVSNFFREIIAKIVHSLKSKKNILIAVQTWAA